MDKEIPRKIQIFWLYHHRYQWIFSFNNLFLQLKFQKFVDQYLNYKSLDLEIENFLQQIGCDSSPADIASEISYWFYSDRVSIILELIKRIMIKCFIALSSLRTTQFKRKNTKVEIGIINTPYYIIVPFGQGTNSIGITPFAYNLKQFMIRCYHFNLKFSRFTSVHSMLLIQASGHV